MENPQKIIVDVHRAFCFRATKETHYQVCIVRESYHYDPRLRNSTIHAFELQSEGSREFRD